MTAALVYKIVTGLLAFWAFGHGRGFARVDPTWGVDEPIAKLKDIKFTALGTPNRTYWGFYLGFGHFGTVMLVFAAAISLQLGLLPAETLRSLQFASWSFAVLFSAAALVTWRYFFTVPTIFSALIAIGLIVAAVLAR
jgi:hypothetical protein